MDINEFITKVKSINWHNYTETTPIYGQKSWCNYSETISASLITLALAESGTSAGILLAEHFGSDLLLNPSISHDVLSAIGNDHGGTYYPVVCEALPFIFQVALFGNHLVARNSAINILIDLYYFGPEATPDGEREKLLNFVRISIKTVISENRDNFVKFSSENPGNESLIETLLSLIDKND